MLYGRCVECRHEIRDVPALPFGNAFRVSPESQKRQCLQRYLLYLLPARWETLDRSCGMVHGGDCYIISTKSRGGTLRRKTPWGNVKVVIGPRVLSLPNDNPRWLMLRGHRYCAGTGSWPKSLCCCQGCILLAICWVCWLSFQQKITVAWWVFNMFEPQEYGGIKDKDVTHEIWRMIQIAR